MLAEWSVRKSLQIMGNTNLSPCEIKILLGEGSKLKNTFVTKLLGCMTWTSHFASLGPSGSLIEPSRQMMKIGVVDF